MPKYTAMLQLGRARWAWVRWQFCLVFFIPYLRSAAEKIRVKIRFSSKMVIFLCVCGVCVWVCVLAIIILFLEGDVPGETMFGQAASVDLERE